MSSSVSSIAPQTVAWELARGWVPIGDQDSRRAEVQNRYDFAHELFAAPRVQAAQTQGTAVVRQRFYPAQLRRLLSLDLHALAAKRKHRLSWLGWDRSLPRMYLPVEPLLRLIMEAVDGITQQSDSSASVPASLKMRVEFQPIADSPLVLALDAEQWQCETQFRGALNARWFRQGSHANLWHRLARQCDIVGGWLSVGNLPGGGASLLINLPTDQPRPLVHSWLSRRSTNELPFSLSLYAIGRSQSESADELGAANIRLQSLARSTDYIYRVAQSRWVWLTTEPELPAFLDTPAWHSEQLDRWTCANSYAATIDLSSRIESRFRELMGTRVPPLDLRTQSISRGPVTANRPNSRVDQAAQVSHTNHLNTRSKWRYPI